MEFLMTYGWAIVVVLVVLSALYFLGVFSPRTVSACEIQAPFVCQDMLVDEGGVTFLLGNLNVDTITGVNISVNGQMCDEIWINDNFQNSVSGVKNQEVSVECSGLILEVNDKITTEINFTYTSNNLDHTIKGGGSGSSERGNSHLGGNFVLHMDGDIVDSGPNSYAGVLYGDTDCTVDGRVGQACSFDGDGDFISYGSLFNFKTTDNFTVSLFLKKEGSCLYNQCGVIGNAKYHDGGWMVIVNPSSRVAFVVNDDTREYRVTDISALPLDEWVHVVGVYEEGSMELFIDGDSVGTNTGDLTISPNSFLVGDSPQGGWYHFLGSIDEVRVWERALTQDEVEDLYNSYN